MDFGRIVKWLLILGLVVFAWRVFLPWMKQQKLGGESRVSISQLGDDSCSGEAERASEQWGSGLVRFVNPPYDIDAWSTFRAGVDSRISIAESKCNCPRESCAKVRNAMSDLRSLVADLDNAIRTGSSPGGNIVQRQEHIDTLIEESRELMRAGK
ncbi:MAG TPA: hypothetical protein VEK79_04180 [Thermoanaerobaculia bacterium]|nr:hypothetical protein [Thermoanaerobaculia bacterium]